MKINKEHIERRALLNEIEEIRPLNWTDTEAEITERLDYDIFENLVKSHPTADVQEVRHGKNITKIHPTDEFICSECGYMDDEITEIVHNEDGDYFYLREYQNKYCPNCGAKMDEE